MLPILVIAAGFTGYILFQDQAYMASALFIVASHLIAAYWVYTISSRKPAFS